MAQSYTNPCGSGNRRERLEVSTNATLAGATLDTMWDGATASGGLWWNGAQASRYVLFDFMEPRIIDEAKWYQSDSSGHGTWQWQGSNDGVSFANIGATFTLGGAATQTQSSLNGNTTAYRFYRLQQTAGATSGSPYLREIEFRIDLPDGSQPTWTDALSWGNRSSLITVSSTATFYGGPGKLVDGGFGNDCYLTAGQSGKSITFDFGAPKRITEAKWIQSASAAHGNWKWQGSNDGAVWSDIGADFVLGSVASQHLTTLNGNASGYRYYRLLQVSGATSVTPWLFEIFFKLMTGAPSVSVMAPIMMLEYS